MPANIEEFFEDLLQALRAVAEGKPEEMPGEAFDRALRAALEQGNQHRSEHWVTSTTFTGTISDHVRRLRKEAGWTQAELATAMRGLGFRWRRVTVAEIEAAGMMESEESRRSPRRVSWEELLGLAALFAEPMVRFLLPKESVLEFPAKEITPGEVEDLLVGRGGRIGAGGTDWETAARVCGDPHDGVTDRPAAALWNRRKAQRNER